MEEMFREFARVCMHFFFIIFLDICTTCITDFYLSIFCRHFRRQMPI
jgi:hypothetical protein